MADNAEHPMLPFQSPPTEISALLGFKLRVIRPGDVVTRDLVSNRFDIEVDEHDIIIKTKFG